MAREVTTTLIKWLICTNERIMTKRAGSLKALWDFIKKIIRQITTRNV